MIRYKKDTDNIVTLTMDMSGRAANVINHEIARAFVPVIEHLKEEMPYGCLLCQSPTNELVNEIRVPLCFRTVPITFLVQMPRFLNHWFKKQGHGWLAGPKPQSK